MATVSSTATIASRGTRPRLATRHRKLIARGSIIAGALLVAVVILPSSLATWADVDSPQIAARIAPWNAAASADSAAALGAHPQSAFARSLVTRALDRDLTQVPAIEMRALDLAVSGNESEARQLFHWSDQLSRRSLATRLWLIQDAVDHGDVAGALRDFDIALRTTIDAQPILFPVLAKASADPRLTTALARTFDKASDWRLMFFEWTLANNVDPLPIAKVVSRMRDRQFVVANNIDQRLVQRLASAGEFDAAKSLNRDFGHQSVGVADPNFGDAGARYPFGWELVSNGSISAQRALSGSSTILSYSAETANSGQVAAQLLVLTPGRYVLMTKTASNGTGASPYWSASCAVTGTEIARLDQPLAANAIAKTTFAVPSGCGAQWLTLRIRPAPDSNTQAGSIASISVFRS